MRPNIVMYFSDQQRADTCGCYGQKLDITPNLDQLAKEGIKFENAFSYLADAIVIQDVDEKIGKALKNRPHVLDVIGDNL